MKRFRFIGLALVLVLGLLAWRVGRREPSYKGKSASAWLRLMTEGGAESMEASVAFRNLDADSVPVLIKSLARRETLTERFVRENWVIAPDFIKRRIRPRIPAAHLRNGAVAVLRDLGPAAAPAVPALAAALADPDPAFKVSCVAAILATGPAAASAAPALTQMLGESDSDLRKAAGSALMEIWRRLGEDPRQQLAKSLKAAHPLIRLGAAESLIENGSSTEPDVSRVLVDLLDHARPDVRADAGTALLRCDRGDPKMRLRAAAILVRDGSIKNRTEAFQAIEEAGPAVRGVRPFLIAALSSPDYPDRYRAALALSAVAFDDPDATYAVMTPDAEGGVTFSAVSALGRFEVLDRRVVPALISMLGANHFYSLTACGVLSRMGTNAFEAVPALLPLLDHPTNQIRAAAARTLGRIGPASAVSVPKLRGMFQDPDAGLQAAGAVLRIETHPPSDVIAFLEDEIKRAPANSFRRIIALEALLESRQTNSFVVDSARAAFQSGQAHQKIRAAGLAWRLERNEEAMRFLTGELFSTDSFASTSAAQTLGELRELARPALPELRRALETTARNRRVALHKALWLIDPKTLEAETGP